MTRLARATSAPRIRDSSFALAWSELANETICAATGRCAAIESMLATTRSRSKVGASERAGARDGPADGVTSSPDRGGCPAAGSRQDLRSVLDGEPGGGVGPGERFGKAEAL